MSIAVADRRVWLRDGRTVMYRVYGDPDGRPVLALHGTPGSRSKFAMAHARAHETGLRLVCIDRWGYGGSDRPSRPTLSGFAADMAALADALRFDRFAVVGVSGGGPYAAAVAAELGARVTALALVAPVGPIKGAGSERVRLSPFHILSFRVMPRVPGAIRLSFGVFRTMLGMSSAGALRLAAARAGALDRQTVCAPAARDSLAECFRLGLAGGLAGPVIDMRLFSAAWDVDPGAITAQARLWLGSEDRNVPLLAARALARAIPGCVMVPLPGHGHFWITQHYGQVLAWLSEVTRRQH